MPSTLARCYVCQEPSHLARTCPNAAKFNAILGAISLGVNPPPVVKPQEVESLAQKDKNKGVLSLLNSLTLLEGRDRVFDEDAVYLLNYAEVMVGGHKVVAMIDLGASNHYVSS